MNPQPATMSPLRQSGPGRLPVAGSPVPAPAGDSRQTGTKKPAVPSAHILYLRLAYRCTHALATILAKAFWPVATAAARLRTRLENES